MKVQSTIVDENKVQVYGLILSLVKDVLTCTMVNNCHNPSFGLATKAKGLQGCGAKGSLKIKAKRS